MAPLAGRLSLEHDHAASQPALETSIEREGHLWRRLFWNKRRNRPVTGEALLQQCRKGTR